MLPTVLHGSMLRAMEEYTLHYVSKWLQARDKIIVGLPRRNLRRGSRKSHAAHGARPRTAAGPRDEFEQAIHGRAHVQACQLARALIAAIRPAT